jgi:hypothetical protein
MKNKLVFVLGMAVGYLVGTWAGRDSYEKLKVTPRHDATPHKDVATSGTPEHDHAKAYAPPESDFYGIGGPASHSSPDADPAQQAHRDETGGQNRTD